MAEERKSLYIFHFEGSTNLSAKPKDISIFCLLVTFSFPLNLGRNECFQMYLKINRPVKTPSHI